MTLNAFENYVIPRSTPRPVGAPNVLNVSDSIPVKETETLKRYSSVFSLRPSIFSESPQMGETLDAVVRVHDAAVGHKEGLAVSVLDTLTEIVPVVNYHVCDSLMTSMGHYFSNPTRINTMTLGQHIEVLTCSLMWKPNAHKLARWLRIANNIDTNVCICLLCHTIVATEDVTSHMSSRCHVWYTNNSAIYECYPCGVSSDDPQFQSTHEGLASHNVNVETHRERHNRDVAYPHKSRH